MLKLIKKYRSNPKRMVVTFFIQRKVLLNRLSDLTQRKETSCDDIHNTLFGGKFGTMPGCEADKEYVLEKEIILCNEKTCKDTNGRVILEQPQVLEKDGSVRAFKGACEIRPVECTAGKENTLFNVKNNVQGGLVCEKACKILLCDLVMLACGVFSVICCCKAMSKLLK